MSGTVDFYIDLEAVQELRMRILHLSTALEDHFRIRPEPGAFEGAPRLQEAYESFDRGWTDGRARIAEDLNEGLALLERAVESYRQTDEGLAAAAGGGNGSASPDGAAATGVGEGPPGHAARRSRPGFSSRFEATNRYIFDRISALDSEIAALQTGPGNQSLRDQAAERIFGWQSPEERNAARVAALLEEKARLEPLLGDSLATDEPRQFLMVDATAADNRAVEVIGDLEAADRVIIHVPGMNTDLGDYAPGGHRDASALYTQLTSTGERVAVVSFMDYNVPDDPAEAASSAGAESGVHGLRTLVGDLQSMGISQSRIGVVAHSYGSVVVGHAMKEGLDVSRVVVLGSPGMGHGVDDRADLGSPHVELYAAKAEGNLAAVAAGALGPLGPVLGAAAGNAISGGDYVSPLPGHGEDPSDEGFGATVFDVGSARGHSQYFRERSTSLNTIANLLLERDIP